MSKKLRQIRQSFENISSDAGIIVFEFLKIQRICQLARTSKTFQFWSGEALRRERSVFCPQSVLIPKILKICPKISRILKDFVHPKLGESLVSYASLTRTPSSAPLALSLRR